MRESALVLYRDELISVSRGQPATVEFNFEEVWDYRRKLGKAFTPRHLYWVHVHPSGFGTQPSSTDQLCAQALHAAFGVVAYFGILCFSSTSFRDFKGRITWYRWDAQAGMLKVTNDRALETDPILLDEEVAILKTLSYGESWSSQSTGSEPSVQISSSS